MCESDKKQLSALVGAGVGALDLTPYSFPFLPSPDDWQIPAASSDSGKHQVPPGSQPNWLGKVTLLQDFGWGLSVSGPVSPAKQCRPTGKDHAKQCRPTARPPRNPHAQHRDLVRQGTQGRLMGRGG